MNMLSQTTHRLLFAAIIALPITGIVNKAHAQRITYKEVEVKRTIDEPVTKTRWVEKRTFETDLETRQKQVVQTEKRQRVIITQKPVIETKYRTEKIKRQKPITVEKFRERRTKHTTYKTVTGYRDETETIREPVIETGMRTEKVTVKKPVTKDLIEVQKTTTLKPVVKKETQYDLVVITLTQSLVCRSIVVVACIGSSPTPLCQLAKLQVLLYHAKSKTRPSNPKSLKLAVQFQ